MSVNKRTRILHRIKDSQGADRELEVFEEDNSQDLVNANTLYANTYSRITFEYEYKTSAFECADVYITNRFTMDTYKKDPPISFVVGELQFIAIPNTVSYFQASVDTARKRTKLEVVLSMADFMFGDIYVQFYDNANPEDTEEEKKKKKEQYCEPIIVQFTNAPTIHAVGVYKWRPNFTTRNVEDYDNIFTSSFGCRRDYISEAGRSDVLTAGVNTDYYNDFMSNDRLITNGCADPNKVDNNEVSISGHPVYMVEYRSFVPSAFSEMFGVNHSPTVVSFSARNNGKGYLTSAVDDWQVMNIDKLDLRMYTKDDDTSFLNTEYQLTAAKLYDNTEKTIGGIRRVFVAHLTANSADRPDDEWFRDHTRVCADFVLTGLDHYWTGESDELPVLTTDRLYYVFNNVSYTPNVFELSWFAAGNGTSYYLVKKCPAGQNRTEWINNTDNWIQVFTKENNSNYLLSDKTICADNNTVMCKENDPVESQNADGIKYITDPSECIYDNIEDIELDNNGRPLVVHENYTPSHTLHGRRSFSDGSRLSYEAYPSFAYFRVMDETVENGLHAVVYRVSDNGGSDSNFELDDADAEFAIIYRA